MKLEHLIQGYNFNLIPAKVKDEVNSETGVITYLKSEDINASYLLNEDRFVTALIIFSNCVVRNNKTLDNQLKHTIDTLIVIQKTIELLGNASQEEANKILNKLGLFDKKIKKKAVCFRDYVYEVDIIDGLLKLSMIDNKESNLIEKIIPPLKSTKK